MTTVRFAIDLSVEGGDHEEIALAIINAKKLIGNFTKDVAVRDDPDVDVSSLKMEVVGGHAHVHAGDGYCGTCEQYARKDTLPKPGRRQRSSK